MKTLFELMLIKYLIFKKDQVSYNCKKMTTNLPDCSENVASVSSGSQCDSNITTFQ